MCEMFFYSILNKFDLEITSGICLAWSDDYETAVHNLSDTIPQAATCVWFQVDIQGVETILKFCLNKKTSKWQIQETCEGTIHFENSRAFDKVPPVFSQNKIN